MYEIVHHALMVTVLEQGMYTVVLIGGIVPLLFLADEGLAWYAEQAMQTNWGFVVTQHWCHVFWTRVCSRLSSSRSHVFTCESALCTGR